MSSVAKGSQQEPGTRTPWHMKWMEEVSFSRVLFLINEWLWKFASATDLIMTCHKFNLKLQGKQLISKGILQWNHFSTTSINSTTHNEELLITFPMLSTAKPRGKVSIPARVYFSEPKVPVQEGFLTNVDGSSKDISIFKKSISLSLRSVHQISMNVANLHAQGELSWEFAKF